MTQEVSKSGGRGGGGGGVHRPIPEISKTYLVLFVYVIASKLEIKKKKKLQTDGTGWNRLKTKQLCKIQMLYRKKNC